MMPIIMRGKLLWPGRTSKRSACVRTIRGGGQAAIKGSADNFPASYAYGLPNGTSVNIPIKTNVIPDDQDILPHMINLTNQVFNKDNVADYGTLGCLVKPTGAEYRRTVPDDLLP